MPEIRRPDTGEAAHLADTDRCVSSSHEHRRCPVLGSVGSEELLATWWGVRSTSTGITPKSGALNDSPCFT